MRGPGQQRVMILALGLAALLGAASATAQAPPPPAPAMSPEAAEISACLCLKAASERLGGEMAAKQRALDDLRQQLDRATTELEAERARVDVNDPQSVSRFRQLLERRDGLFRRSNGDMVADARAAVERYNARIGEYNSRCASRPMNAELMARLQATLTCPPLP